MPIRSQGRWTERRREIQQAYNEKHGITPLVAVMADLEKRMFEAAENLEFEEAARLRDEMEALKKVSEGAEG